MSIKHKYFARCMIREPSGRKLEQDVQVGSRDPSAISLPEGTESFRFFERIQGYVEVDGEAIPVQSKDFALSPGHIYPKATRRTYHEYANHFPQLVIPRASSSDIVMVQLPGNSWYRLMPDDVILELVG